MASRARDAHRGAARGGWTEPDARRVPEQRAPDVEATTMNALILYDSEYGNTERIAQAIAHSLETPRLIHARMLVADPGAAKLAECDLLVVGGPTQAHGISPRLRAV